MITRISIRPITLLATTLAFIVLVTVAGKMILAPEHQSGSQKTMASMEKEQLRLNTKLSETEALLALRDAEIESNQQQLQQDRQSMQDMRQRLNLFNQVLAERKKAGVHFLRPSASWKDEHTIAYQLILVKGKNYPRWIIGHLAFTVTDAQGHSMSLAATKKKNSGDKIEMTSQSFIEGELTWQASWKPKILNITLFNHKGRKKGSIRIPIAGAPYTKERAL